MSSSRDRASLIKARYAMRVVKAAKSSDRMTALRLLMSLIDDTPTPGESPEAAELHRDALRKFTALAQALGSSRDAGPLWYPAERAALKWVDLLEGD